MGMGASQARLLQYTANMQSLELRAQIIQNKKIALATEEDEVYLKYNNALEKTKISVAYNNGDGTRSYMDANYSNLCDFNELTVNQYAVRDNLTNKIIVPENVKDAYEEFGEDPYTFAWAALGFEGNFNWQEGPYSDTGDSGTLIGIGSTQDSEDYGDGIDEDTGNSNLYMTQSERMAYEEFADENLIAKYNAINESETREEKQQALKIFREALYIQLGDEIFEYMNRNKGGFPDDEPEYDNPNMTWGDIQNKFNYYVALWSSIRGSNGCTTIDEQYQSGDNGTEWFNNMINSGLMTIQVLDNNKKTWSDTSVSTSTGTNFLKSVEDKSAIVKAEKEYEYEMKKINKKEEGYDTELSNLETERNAIKTMIEFTKTAIKDNVQWTMGIFS